METYPAARSVFLHTVRVLLGLLFILSGLTKLVDTGNFVRVAWQYMDGGLVTAIAVMLPAAEVVLGLILLLALEVRRAAATVVLLTLFFTVIFAYGYWVKGITDCGCFGKTEWLKLPPWGVFTRNVLIILAGTWLFYRYEDKPVESSEEKELLRYKHIALFCLAPVAFTVAGVSYKSPWFKEEDIIRSSLGKPVSQTSFKALRLAAGRTYGLFIFSPGCTHCWDVSANAASWRSAGLVDSLIAVTGISQKQQAEQRYLPWFKGSIRSIRYLPDREIEKAVSSVPHLVIVQRDTIVHIRSGSIPSGYKLKYFNRKK